VVLALCRRGLVGPVHSCVLVVNLLGTKKSALGAFFV
jgi:hypothetical protein